VIFSENRWPPPDQIRGTLFRIMLLRAMTTSRLVRETVKCGYFVADVRSFCRTEPGSAIDVASRLACDPQAVLDTLVELAA
jgi:hypothetical protein